MRGDENQRNFAQKINLKQTTYSNYESGQREPGLQIVGDVSTQFGVTADWLLGLSDSRAPNGAVTASGGSAAASHNSTATVTGGASAAEISRLLGIIESQQRVIESLTGGKRGA